jgi:adenylate cyclase
MRLRAFRAGHAALTIALALAWAGVLAARHIEGRASFLDRLEAPLLDLRFAVAGPLPAPRDILIVAIDDETVHEANSYPLPRWTVAQLVQRIRRLGASAIGVDILFLEPGPEADDIALATALAETGAVIAAAAIFPAGAERGETELGIPQAARMIWPDERFRKVAAVGTVNIATDQGGTLRHAPLVLGGPDGIVPSFPLRLAAGVVGGGPVLAKDAVRIGSVAVPTDLAWALPLRFYGPRGTVPTVSAAAILKSDALRDMVQGRAVLIGATAIGTGDVFATPFDPVLPGVEVLATATSHLLHADGLLRNGRVRRIDAVAALGLAALSAGALALLPPGAGLLLAAALWAAWLAATLVAFWSGYWLSAVLPLAAAAPGMTFGLLGRQALDRIRTGRLLRSEENLRRFQAPALAARLATDPAYLGEPVALEAAVLFLDLNGFTGVSERLGPERTRAMLKGFHAALCEAVEGRGGVVMNFMGDGAMALFGVPDPASDDAARALLASAEVVQAVRAWLSVQADGTGAEIGIRVGAHYGPVILSRLGSAAQEQITATGDSVNVASRLLEVAKHLGAALVVTDDLIRAAGSPPDFVAALEGRRRVDIRGRVQPLEIAYRWVEDVPAKASTAVAR